LREQRRCGNQRGEALSGPVVEAAACVAPAPPKVVRAAARRTLRRRQFLTFDIHVVEAATFAARNIFGARPFLVPPAREAGDVAEDARSGSARERQLRQQ